MAKIKEKEPKDTSELSKNLLGALVTGYKDTNYNHIVSTPVKFSSGSLKLDSYIKMRSGITIRMGGPSEVGKTSQSMLFADNYMKALPKSKTIYINAEAKFGEEIQARTGMKFTEDPSNWDYGTVFVYQTNVFDTICDTLESILKQMHQNGEHLCMIIDSIDMLRLESSLNKKAGDNKRPAGTNFLLKEMLRRLDCIYKYNALLIIITQYAATFKADQYAKDEPHLMGGNNTHALNHQCTYALYYKPRGFKDYIKPDIEAPPDKEKNPILGVYAKILLCKTATDVTGHTIEVPIKKGRIGNCVWVEKEVVDVAMAYGLINKKGGWFAFDESVVSEAKNSQIELKSPIQGLDNLYDYFENNKPVFEWFLNKIKGVIV